MKSKSLILFLVAAGFGLVAMLGVMQVMEARAEKEPDVKVLVATAEIFPGDAMNEENTGFKVLPKSAAPRGAVTDRAQMENMTVITRVVADDFITMAKLSEGMIAASRDIPLGMRVCTVKVDSTKSHSGLMRPGDRVDVLCTYKRRDSQGQQSTSTKTVLEYIEVFSIDNIRNNGEGDPGDVQAKNISLLVSPEHAALLKLAETKGELHLSLRHKDDVDMAAIPDIDSSIFEETAPGQGERPEEKKSADDAPKTGDLQSFLAQHTGEPAKDDAEKAEPKVEIPTWTITIYRGEEVEDVEVVDEEALASLNLDAVEKQRARATTRKQNRSEKNGAEKLVDEVSKDADKGKTDKTSPSQPSQPDLPDFPQPEQTAEDIDWVQDGLDSIKNF
ncbi:Flp pilus assembly protein CpaB [Calycomorphotria hydatis]|uniref:Flp pilus assembly protein RcpC/CpaB domain-containing protein n=1 Tax=Calycomorphotria hydatis TaxID=2528027 RepID=A0A517T7Y2_9PLAN|nr:Flp pilus assembly protein CpaB [Calycomorphotria hydatis]QDT64472.1 hypothetical protein V22_17060 [Calycomorphotria hydatis]